MPFFAPPPPPPPVSYSREVAPILAMRCSGCHGDAGGLSTRSHAELIAGGNSGRVVIPGDPERSLLMHFIDGRRGEARRMPMGGRPLRADQIQAIRRWIDEGARLDAPAPPDYLRVLQKVMLPRDRILRVSCRVKTDAYLTMTVREPRNGRALLTHVASLKSEREQGDAGQPGELIWWDVRSERRWPKLVDIELRVEHAAGDADHTEFAARLLP